MIFQTITQTMRAKQWLIVSIIGLFLVVYSCSTKKNTRATRAYHNLNTHYNIYFNANENLKKGVAKIDENYIDNYTEILSIYRFGDATSASTANGEMETVLKKVASLIKQHSIKKKPQRKNNKKMSQKEKDFYAQTEFNKWIDDAYLIMGQAYFYKLEYSQALRIFEFIVQNFKSEQIQLKAQYWIVRTYIEQQDYRNAKSKLDLLKGMGKIPDKMVKDVALLTAHLYLEQNDYDEAAIKLKLAIRETRKKRERARYTFILAQIYQKLNNNTQAADLYAKISKLNPTYEMLFNANINSAVAFSGNSKSGDMIKVLEKMLRDEKNEDFKDQIYYALANIFRKKGDIETAKKYYTLSSAVSKTNKNQKAVSCLALADIYFNEPKYKLAQAYYDSTILNLDKNYPDYEAVYLKTKNLTALVNNLTTIFVQDSLQSIAKLSEKDRTNLINQRIQDYKNNEARKKAEQNPNSNRDPIFDEDLNRVTTTQSSLPFYNPATLARSMDMFKRKWGDRKLEDNWRRINKSIVMETSEENVADNNSDAEEKFTQEDVEFYLVDLPLTDSLLKASDDKIEKAYFAAGEIYMDKLGDYKEAILIYEQLNKHFPDGRFLLDSYYYLYKMNTELGKESEADRYKQLIISDFPNSTQAILFTNPNYLNQLKADKLKVDEQYIKAYTQYKENNFRQSIELSKQALSVFPNNYIEPKFDFLIALSTAALSAPDAAVLQQQLREVIAKHPKSDEAEKADEMLKTLNSTQGNNSSQANELYSSKTSRNYSYVLILKNSFNINRIEFDIAKFNINNFSMVSFSVTNKDLLKSEKMITVAGITNLDEIKTYFAKIKQDKEIRNDLKMENFEEFIISEENLKIFEIDKNAKLYIQFMNQTLLK